MSVMSGLADTLGMWFSLPCVDRTSITQITIVGDGHAVKHVPLRTVYGRYDPSKVDDPTKLTLQHYENGVWANGTTSNQSPVICGSVTSLSPFAIFQTPSAKAARAR
jgi:hypothetical protein